MDFKTLRGLKSIVVAHNSHLCWDDVELWFPHMYDIGQWSCTLVFGKTVDNDEMSDFLLFLYGNSCRFFIGTLNDDIAIFVQ